jgi:hypothetical protein
VRHLTLLIFILGAGLAAQPTVFVESVGEAFDAPVDLTNDPARPGYVFVVEKGGRAYRWNPATDERTPYVDLSDRVITRSESGLLGMAFHPDPDSSYLYVYYTQASANPGAASESVVSRFTDRNGTPDPDSERVLLRIEQPALNHNGGDLAFGPDGYLYISVGDGGGAHDEFDHGQNPNSLLGSLLRIDVDGTAENANYRIPADNPFVGAPDTLPEIWALGLRNPWRISFDRATGDLWMGDVGQNKYEEINWQPAGSPGGVNYGWNCREGRHSFRRAIDRRCNNPTMEFTDPVIEYAHGEELLPGFTGQSVTGGYRYRGPDEGLRGYYIFADYVRPKLFLFNPDRTGADSLMVIDDAGMNNVSTFGEAADGSLYAASLNGQVYRIGREATTAVAESSPTLDLRVFPNPLRAGMFTLQLPPGWNRASTAERLLDGLGREIPLFRQPGSGATGVSFTTGELAPGVYHLVVSHGDQIGHSRMVVQ